MFMKIIILKHTIIFDPLKIYKHITEDNRILGIKQHEDNRILSIKQHEVY